MVDLPLIDEDAGVFGNEVAIQRCVFRCAENERTRSVSPLQFHITFIPVLTIAVR